VVLISQGNLSENLTLSFALILPTTDIVFAFFATFFVFFAVNSLKTFTAKYAKEKLAHFDLPTLNEYHQNLSNIGPLVRAC